MAQLGLDTDSAGNRTTSETYRRIVYNSYSNSDASPVLRGGAVTGTATMAYHVAAGTAVCKTAEGQAVYVVWDETDTALTTAPATGTERDVIYVDRDGVVGVARYGSVPASPWYVTLDVRTISAGQTSTTATVSGWDKNFALTYGTSSGELASWSDPATPDTEAAKDWTIDLSFSCPRDMDITVEILQSLKTENLNELNPGTILWTLTLDNPRTVTRCEIDVDRRRATRQYLCVWRGVPVGAHTVRIDRHTQWLLNPNTKVTHFGNSDGFVPTIYRIRQYGVAQ